MRVVCHACGAGDGARERVGRRDTCTRCGADLHSCRQCRFYDASAYNACREPQAERVLDKERANFCDYFAPAEAGSRTPSSPAASVPGTRTVGRPPAVDAPPAPAPAADTRAALDRLFRRR